MMNRGRVWRRIEDEDERKGTRVSLRATVSLDPDLPDCRRLIRLRGKFDC